MYIRKVLLISKLAFGLVLAFVIVRTAMIPQEMGKVFVPSPAAGTETISAVVGRPEETPIEDYSAIVARNIFGDANSSLSANKSMSGENTDELLQSAEEELGLALVGTVCGSPAVSRAVIKDTKTDILNLYKTGQTVGGACVESIEKNAVILLHNGQRKILTLKTAGRDDQGHVQTPLPQTVSQTSRVAEPNLLLNQASAQSPAKIEQVASMLEKAVVEPYVVKGQVEGLRITGLEEISGARDIGLKNGDIIRAVNGQQLTDKQKAYQIFKKARSQAVIDIELLRDNESRKLSFALQ